MLSYVSWLNRNFTISFKHSCVKHSFPNSLSIKYLLFWFDGESDIGPFFTLDPVRLMLYRNRFPVYFVYTSQFNIYDRPNYSSCISTWLNRRFLYISFTGTYLVISFVNCFLHQKFFLLDKINQQLWLTRQNCFVLLWNILDIRYGISELFNECCLCIIVFYTTTVAICLDAIWLFIIANCFHLIKYFWWVSHLNHFHLTSIAPYVINFL